MADTLGGGSAQVTIGNSQVVVATTSQAVYNALLQLQASVSSNNSTVSMINTSSVTSNGVVTVPSVASNGVVVLSGSLASNSTVDLPSDFTGSIVLATTTAGNSNVTAQTPITIDGGNGQYTIVVGDTPINLNISKTDPTTKFTVTTGQGSSVLDPVGGATGYYNPGGGNDTIYQTTGTVYATTVQGDNLLVLGGSTGTVTSGGNDTIYLTNGALTVTGGTTGYDYVHGGDANIWFVGGTNASTVLGGLGGGGTSAGSADTLNGGQGGGVFSGGWGGNNLLWGGNGAVTLIGGGANDTLFASNASANNHTNVLFAAGTGNETLAAGTATGNNIYSLGGTGNDQVIAEGAQDTIWAGAGNDSIWNSTGNDLIVLFKGNTDGTANITLQDFTLGHTKIQLFGYGETGAQIVATAQVSGGNTTVTLNDGSKVTFNVVTNLTASSFING